MQTIMKPAVWKILKILYDIHNTPLHLRKIARKTKMNESSVSRHLNKLVKENVLKTTREANLKKFCVAKNKIPEIFPLYDSEKLESLPLLRKDAIKLYINKLEKKPLLVVVFGSTAKGTYLKDSDIDLLKISFTKEKDEKAEKYAETQTGIRIQVFDMTEKQFKNELKTKNDMVIQAGLETGFPVFNAKYYYEVMYNE